MSGACRRGLLLFGALANCLIALLHAVIIFVGAPGYRYFGTPDLAVLQEKGSLIPAVLTFVLVLLFSLFATYALSGAGVLRRLPLLRTVLLAVGAVYVLRGFVLIQDIMRLMVGELKYPRAIAFSGVALLIGIAYIAGTIPLFKKQGERG